MFRTMEDNYWVMQRYVSDLQGNCLYFCTQTVKVFLFNFPSLCRKKSFVYFHDNVSARSLRQVFIHLRPPINWLFKILQCRICYSALLLFYVCVGDYDLGDVSGHVMSIIIVVGPSCFFICSILLWVWKLIDFLNIFLQLLKTIIIFPT